MKYAVIDIGSNSVRLLLWADGCSLSKKISTTRLGEGLAFTGCLAPAAITRTIQAIGDFIQIAEAEKVDRIDLFATAAVRESSNGKEFVAIVQKTFGMSVDILSGEREALLGFLGALEGRDGGIIDIGGASTEVTVGKNGKVVYAVSVPIGAVRLRDSCGEDPAKLSHCIAEKMDAFSGVPYAAPWIAIGGTATSLAALEYAVEPYDSKIIHGKTMTALQIESWAKRLLSMSQEERIQLKGMDRRRADILGGGALLFGMLLKRQNISAVTISEADNLEGYLLEKNGGVDR